MLKRTISILSILLISLVLQGCNDQSNSSIQLNDDFTLKVGQTARLESEQIDITFLEVEEDSRCPSQADCAWIGQVSVLLQVEIEG